jgi:signal transduction histidine kinase
VHVASQDPSQIRLTVTDSGPGIPAKYQSSIFDKFTQVRSKRENKSHSTGLGLTFCKLVIEAQDGQIGVQSEEGKGSLFWFCLPVAKEVEHSQEHAMSGGGQSREDELQLAATPFDSKER